MADKIFDAFLQHEHDQAMALARASDLLELFPAHPIDGPPDRYLAHFRCTGLVKQPGGTVTTANDFVVGISFPSDYLARVNPAAVLTWLQPWSAFHPNIKAPFVCVGRIVPGTPLVDLLYQLFELITYTKVTMREDDALNRDACAWARQHAETFPVDRRPLKRRVLDPGAVDAVAEVGR